jgi:hypothetical protein
MNFQEQHQSRLIISYRNDKFYIEKDMEGPVGETNLIGVITSLFPYSGLMQPIIKECADKLKVYLPFA